MIKQFLHDVWLGFKILIPYFYIVSAFTMALFSIVYLITKEKVEMELAIYFLGLPILFSIITSFFFVSLQYITGKDL